MASRRPNRNKRPQDPLSAESGDSNPVGATSASGATLSPTPPETIRLNRFLASCGYGSRRACDDLIASGSVTVNEQPAKTGQRVDPAGDDVRVFGETARPEEIVVYLLNKPKDVVCTSSDPQGRRTFLEFFSDESVRVFCVGRLDRDSEGLLLVTNDGLLTQRILHPRYEIDKVYHVTVDRLPSPRQNQSLLEGVTDGPDVLRAKNVHAASENTLEITLGEGKNRHIRRMLASIGIDVRKLRRTRIGPLSIKGLRLGETRPISQSERNQLNKLLEID